MSHYSLPLKARIAGEVMRGELTVDQAVDTYGISRTTVFRWLAAARTRLNSLDQATVSARQAQSAPQAGSAATGGQTDELDELVSRADAHGSSAYEPASRPDGDDRSDAGADMACRAGADGASADGTDSAEAAGLTGAAGRGPAGGADGHVDEDALIAGAASALAAMQSGSPCSAQSTIVKGREYLSFNGGPQISLVKFISSAALAAHYGWEDRRAASIAHEYNCSVEQLRSTLLQLEGQGLVSASHYQSQRQQLFEADARCEQLAADLAAAREDVILLNRSISLLKEHFGVAEGEGLHISHSSRRRIVAVIQEFNRSGLTIGRICQLLGLNVRSYYRWLKQITEQSDDALEDDEYSNRSGRSAPGHSDGHSANADEDAAEAAAAMSAAHSSSSEPPLPEVRPARRRLSINDELATVREALYSERFAGAPALTIYRQLKEAGQITVCQRSFYNIVDRIHQLEKSGQLPRPHQAVGPARQGGLLPDGAENQDTVVNGDPQQGTNETHNAGATQDASSAAHDAGAAAHDEGGHTAMTQTGAAAQADNDSRADSGQADDQNMMAEPEGGPGAARNAQGAAAADSGAYPAPPERQDEKSCLHSDAAADGSDADSNAPEAQNAYDEEGIPMMQPLSLDDLD